MKYTLLTLQSILDNEDTFDVVVFDDNSEDGTADNIRVLGFEVVFTSPAVGTTAI